ncbi:hypothetical protein LZG00_01040 [Rhodobacteraceae bacterium LMO-12]|nr:hypothetical protein [Rhodobacteraceae bacterium LMO-JJ12]
MSESGKGYIDTLYTRTRASHMPAPQLAGEAEADVCVIGGGRYPAARVFGVAACRGWRNLRHRLRERTTP